MKVWLLLLLAWYSRQAWRWWDWRRRVGRAVDRRVHNPDAVLGLVVGAAVTFVYGGIAVLILRGCGR